MLTSNPVFSVLIPRGNAAVLPAGNKVSALAVGQLGFFNSKTHLSFVAGGASAVEDFYIAVGVDENASNDPTAGGTLAASLRSAGQVITRRDIKQLNVDCYTPNVNKVQYITGYSAKCEEDYVMKIFLKNESAYEGYGNNFPAKSFVVRTPCCHSGCNTGCVDTTNAMTLEMVNRMNADPDKMFTAELLDYTTNPNAPAVVAIANFDAWVAANSSNYDLGDSDPTNDVVISKHLGIKVTSIALKVKNYCSVNLRYQFPRGTDIVIALTGGFECAGKVTTITEVQYELNAGYDIQQLEYVAGGWNGTPGIYRLDDSGFPNMGSYKKYAVSGGKYVVFNLKYYLVSVSGERTYESNTETVIAVAFAETTTKNSIAAVLDALASPLPAIAAIANACASS